MVHRAFRILNYTDSCTITLFIHYHHLPLSFPVLQVLIYIVFLLPYRLSSLQTLLDGLYVPPFALLHKQNLQIRLMIQLSP
jgi:hypothetical protein